jgi:electron transfer flavoprotein alpha subunit
MSCVLVIGEAANGHLVPASMEAAAAGAALAQSLHLPLAGGLIGDAPDNIASEFGAGFATLYLAQLPQLGSSTAHTQVAAAQILIKSANPSIILLPHTLRAREWAPALAAALDTSLVMDCIALRLEGELLVAQKPVHGGAVLGEFVLRGSPRVATLRSGAFARAATAPNARVERIDADIAMSEKVTILEDIVTQASSGPKLTDAKIVVAGGRGLGSPDNWHYIETAAAALGGAVGASRPVVDSGWVSSSHQVGLSGNSINADLYVAVGISGAVQHLAGINGSAVVAAINTDGQADIFTRANYGVTGDYKEILPAFVERVKRLKG